jgi:hypothetical protein
MGTVAGPAPRRGVKSDRVKVDAAHVMLRIVRLLPCAVVVVALGGPASAHAATCADYADQASAQRAHDTVDADGDGIYCESLPCPCLKSGDTGPSSPSSPSPSRPKLGRPRTFAPRTKTSGCQPREHLPDAACTPGGYFPGATRSVICRSGYSASVRRVTESTKDKVYAEYGIAHHSTGEYEVDHLVPHEAGGSNQLANLFPQPASPRPGFREKDRLEGAIHDRVCDEGQALRPLQRRIAKDWVALYRDLARLANAAAIIG